MNGFHLLLFYSMPLSISPEFYISREQVRVTECTFRCCEETIINVVGKRTAAQPHIRMQGPFALFKES